METIAFKNNYIFINVVEIYSRDTNSLDKTITRVLIVDFYIIIDSN